MPARARRLKQKRNKINFRNYYKRQKQQKELLKLQENDNSGETNISTSILMQPKSPLPCSSHDKPQDITPHANKQVPRHPLKNLRSRKICLLENNSDSVEEPQAELQSIFSIQQTSSPLPCTSPIPLISPSVSSINSPIPTTEPCSPKSDVSINSMILKREVNTQLRKYQKKKSTEIHMFKKAILKLKLEKEMYRKRLERLEQTLKISPNRKTISNKYKPRKILSPQAKKIRNLVRKFYEDDENTRMTPGKQDCITRNGLKRQKRYLLDNLKNLHRKYLESGFPPISYVTFTRLKPFWIVLPKVDSRDTCLCKPHANMDLLINSLKKNKIISENSTTEILNSFTCKNAKVECLQRKCKKCKNKWVLYNEFDNSHNISYYAWSKNSKTYIKNNIEKVSTIVEKIRKEEKPLEVIKHFENEIIPFMSHCANIKNQYESIKKIKAEITKHECIVHMDFSENYNTKYSSEIQAVHFGASRSQLTLHTAVIYYHENNEIKSQSFCTVSESLRHDASAVWAHLIPILQEIEAVAPHISVLHLISDSPSGQYRNKKKFYIISQLQLYLPNLSRVIWHYCECGHGKGAPDGVGGVLKRSADRLVAFGNDINSINALVEGLRTTVTGVKIKIVQEYEVDEKDWLLPKVLKCFPGSMKIHQIVWTKTCKALAMRSLSCTDKNCLYNSIKCIHGKHLGFYELPIENLDNEMVIQPVSKPNSSIHRFKGSELFYFKSNKIPQDKAINSADASHDLDNIDYDNLVPSASFFQNIDSDLMSKFEKTTTVNDAPIENSKELDIKRKYTFFDTFDSDDENIF